MCRAQPTSCSAANAKQPAQDISTETPIYMTDSAKLRGEWVGCSLVEPVVRYLRRPDPGNNAKYA